MSRDIRIEMLIQIRGMTNERPLYTIHNYKIHHYAYTHQVTESDRYLGRPRSVFDMIIRDFLNKKLSFNSYHRSKLQNLN